MANFSTKLLAAQLVAQVDADKITQTWVDENTMELIRPNNTIRIGGMYPDIIAAKLKEDPHFTVERGDSRGPELGEWEVKWSPNPSSPSSTASAYYSK